MIYTRVDSTKRDEQRLLNNKIHHPDTRASIQSSAYNNPWPPSPIPPSPIPPSPIPPSPNPFETKMVWGCTACPILDTTALNPLWSSAVYLTTRMVPSGSANEYSPLTTSPTLTSACCFWSPVLGSPTPYLKSYRAGVCNSTVKKVPKIRRFEYVIVHDAAAETSQTDSDAAGAGARHEHRQS